MRINKKLKFILFVVCYTIGIIIMLSIINYYSKFKSTEEIEDYYNPPHFKCLGGGGTAAFRNCVSNKRNQMENDIEKWNELKEKGLLK